MNFIGWKRGLLVLGCGVYATAGRAATVAVIDSGLDTEQKELQSKIWLNPIDSTVDQIDEDNNGYTDDIHGWNFVDNSYQLIDHKYADLYDDDVVRYFAVQTNSLKGNAAAADVAWAKDRVKDQDFIKHLMTYGNYAHGTHVSGIIARQGDNVQVIGMKLIPTENPLASVSNQIKADLAEGKDLNWILKGTLQAALIGYAKLQGQALAPLGQYAGTEKADVANGSFGFGPTQAKMLLTPLLKLALGGEDPSPELVNEMAQFFLEQVAQEQESLVRGAPDTLFVFAAGNDGNNNDILPTTPANIKHPHTLSVAAAFDDGRLAPFSNYGDTVDLAAPGVGIESTVPDDHHIQLSGTSQAAPAVAGTAAAIKAINTDLDASELKAILLGTVDVRSALKGKVKTSGMLNNPRALEAARLSKTMSLAQAIATANEKVPSTLPAELLGSLDVYSNRSNDLWLDIQPHLLGN